MYPNAMTRSNLNYNVFQQKLFSKIINLWVPVPVNTESGHNLEIVIIQVPTLSKKL